MSIRIMQSFTVVAFLTASQASAQNVDAAKQMRRDIGAWNVAIKMFVDPSGEPVVGKGTETNVMLGELWLIGRFTGDIMGGSFEGSRQTGFDPEKKKFVASWVDSKNPYPAHTEGDWNEKTQTLTSIGTGKGPSGNEVKMKMVATYNKDGSRTSSMYAIVNGKETKIMEFHYTRIDDKPVKSGEQRVKPGSEK
jgi:Protein of unknown function (DUF1579)